MSDTTTNEKAEAFQELVGEVQLLFHRLKAVSEELHEDAGISTAMRGVMRDLYVNGPQTVPQMARSRPVSRQHIQTIVNSLLEANLVELTDNPAHRRSHLVQLTPEGRSAMKKIFRREAVLLSEAETLPDADALRSAMITLRGGPRNCYETREVREERIMSEYRFSSHGTWAPEKRSQFGCPTGIVGRVIGRMMGKGNEYMNALAARVMKPARGESILEIGFGTGTLIRKLADAMGEGLVAGADVSAVMVKQAKKRNSEHVASGLVDLRQAGATDLPFADESFDTVCAVNSFHHWPSAEDGLREIRRVLRDGGTLFLFLRMKAPKPGPMTPPGFTDDEMYIIERLLTETGYHNIMSELHMLERNVTVVKARR